MSHSAASLIGQSLFLAGMQFSIGSVEQSSRFSVENFSKDQSTLDNAASALSTYIIIGIIWTLATCLVLYSEFGKKGVIWGLITNAIFMAWIVISYWITFQRVVKNN